MRDYGEWGDLDWQIAGEMVGEYVSFVSTYSPGPRIAEFGVGSGRMAVPLLNAGYDVVGLDVSPAMLGVYANRCSPRVVKVCCLDLSGEVVPDISVDCVVAGYNMVSMIPERSGRMNAFRIARSLLQKGGVLIVENFTPLMMEVQMEGSSDKVISSTLNGDEWVIKYKWDRNVEVVVADYWQIVGGRESVWRRVVSSVLPVALLVKEISESGFRLKGLFRDWSANPYRESDPEVLMLWEAE